MLALDNFSARWDDKYPQISRSWRAHWDNLNTLFNYPEDIRKAIYTTNAFESLNSVKRNFQATIFPSPQTEPGINSKLELFCSTNNQEKVCTVRLL